jgi:hypothetical protein
VRRVRHLEKPTKFKDMVWPMMEKFSPLNLFDLKQVSYIDHFRTFVFGNYGEKNMQQKNIKYVVH